MLIPWIVLEIAANVIYHIRESMVELGDSLNKLLTGLEDLGMDAAIPQDMEIDLRHAMDLVEISDAASSFPSQRPNCSRTWPSINQFSPGTNRKVLSITRNQDDMDAGNEADDDMTEEFISSNSPYRGFLQEECDRQVAELFQGGLFKSGSKNTLLENIDDGEDTDADVDDVIDEEEISNFVDFLQFATGGDFRDCVEGSPNGNKDFLEFAAFASAAASAVPENPTLAEVKNINKNDFNDIYKTDTAFSMLPVELALQGPMYEDKGYLKDEVSDVERLFLSTPTFRCKNLDKKTSHSTFDLTTLKTASFKQ